MFGDDVSNLTTNFGTNKLKTFILFSFLSFVLILNIYFNNKKIPVESLSQISIKDGQCIPSEMRIKEGQQLLLKNHDLHSQRLFEINGRFSTDFLRQDQEIKLVFTQLGSFRFKCSKEDKAGLQLIVEK